MHFRKPLLIARHDSRDEKTIFANTESLLRMQKYRILAACRTSKRIADHSIPHLATRIPKLFHMYR